MNNFWLAFINYIIEKINILLLQDVFSLFIIKYTYLEERLAYNTHVQIILINVKLLLVKGNQSANQVTFHNIVVLL